MRAAQDAALPAVERHDHAAQTARADVSVEDFQPLRDRLQIERIDAPVEFDFRNAERVEPVDERDSAVGVGAWSDRK
jgi:hypothetical protein